MTKVPRGFGHNVFLNCPFDRDYEPLFEAAVFTIQIAGFKPRCALEVSNAGRARLAKIMDILSECRFGIHDISRTELGPGKLPRFNMPLELGLDLGCSRWGIKHLAEKRILILDRSLRRHHRSASDLEGQGLVHHANNPQQLVSRIRDWLSTESAGSSIPGGAYIYKRYRLFRESLPRLSRVMKLSHRQLTFPDYSTIVRVWLEEYEG
ncbi:MAG TPA: hypothetical protein DD490_29695 [Acidobacteria bacterium]|nr:hypothetical protein [Acidobacteriota bacterium]